MATLETPQDLAQSLAAVVVTCNRQKALERTVERLLRSPPEELAHLVIVDNASTDGTAEWLRSLDDARLDIVTSNANLGGAGGFELGLRHTVQSHDPDWVVVMDDDARPALGTLERFAAAPRSASDAWVAAVFDAEGNICDMNRPFRNPASQRWGWLGVLLKGRKSFYLSDEDITSTAQCSVDGGTFVGLFLSRPAIARAGYPDGRLFLYGDDVLYTLGLSKAGGTLLFDPALLFEHDFKSQTSARGRFDPVWKSYYHYRNLLFIYRQQMGILFWPALALLVPKWLARSFAYKDEKRAYLKTLGFALRDGLLKDTSRSHEYVRRLGTRQP